VAQGGSVLIADYYDETVTILARTASTAVWGSTATFSANSTDGAVEISAAMNQAGAAERFMADRVTPYVDYKMYCSSTHPITAASRVRWDGEDYDVVETPKNTLQRGHHYKVMLRKVID